VEDALERDCPPTSPVRTCDETQTKHRVLSSPRNLSELADAGGAGDAARICVKRRGALHCVAEAEWWALFPPDAGYW
jgi:hypothetical protein